MSEPTPSSASALAEIEQILAATGPPDAEEPGRSLPDDWRDDPVKVLIAMLLANPSREGAAVALAWFYGRGLPDPRGPAGQGVMDLGATVLEVLRRAVESDGLETVRRHFYDAFGEVPGD